MRHRWAVAGVREVPWQSAPITVRVCRNCGCIKFRESRDWYFRAVFVMPNGQEFYGKTPECPGEGPRDEQAKRNLEADL